jgi:alkyl hydroperoxide reductase subunit D
MEETRKDLLADLGLPEGRYGSLDAYVRGDHKYIRDLRINLKNTLESPHVGKKQAFLIALAVAVNEKNRPLTSSFTEAATREGATAAEVAEVHACASLLSTLNVYYRFKHFSENKHYDTLQAGIKMTIMARPVLGKLFFELISLVVSAVNGCETCVNNHEKSVRQEGGTQELIFDAIRLGATVKGLCVAVGPALD